MARQFKVLQIGGIDETAYFIPQKDTEWHFIPSIEGVSDIDALAEWKPFDLIYVQAPYSEMLMTVFERYSEPYSTYIDQMYWNEQFKNHSLIQQKVIRPFVYQDDSDRHRKLKAVAFPGQYGDKVSPIQCQVNADFKGASHYEGNDVLVVRGEFGTEMRPLLSWKQNLIYDHHKIIQIWPQYTVSEGVEVEYVFHLVPFNSNNAVDTVFVRRQDDLKVPLEISPREEDAYIVVSMRAKGQGVIRVGAIHKRWSRLDMGQFILGGERYVNENTDEFIHYFNPGDRKPPLNVYFSGYRSAEGFEGYFMMNKLQSPFMLIGDPRTEGGAFYLGSDSYEQAIKDVIQKRLDELGFQREDLILSGLSMGSFGALYYGAQMQPAAVVVGKPLVNLGTIAENMALVRPEDFGTALDVIYKNTGNLTDESLTMMNQKFWNKFTHADLSKTTFAISYMAHDDYDRQAFDMMLPILSRQHARVMSRGVPGRHNDDSSTITSWFVNFFHMILEQQFGRRRENVS